MSYKKLHRIYSIKHFLNLAFHIPVNFVDRKKICFIIVSLEIYICRKLGRLVKEIGEFRLIVTLFNIDMGVQPEFTLFDVFFI